MPKFYCEYCGIYLTHSSPSGRKQHAHGRKHIQNKIEYYSSFMLEHSQNINQQKMSNNPLMMRNALSLHQNPLLNYANRNIGLSGLGIPQIGGMPGMNANPTPMVSGYSFITNQMTQMPAEP